MNDQVISVENISKKFCTSLKRSIFYGVLDVIWPFKKNTYLREGEFWALSNISFTLNKGDKLGILGSNGSGKTTLLRIVSGIFQPNGGKVSTIGNVAPLIAVGAGFHPHLSGKENLYINASLLGARVEEIQAKYDEIVQFAEMEKFMELNVSAYSSGMVLRLGFSIAMHFAPDVLLVDEVLAVGDLGFQLKCQRMIGQYCQKGGSLIMVSHNTQAIKNSCNKVLWLEKGQFRGYGDAKEICDEYENYVYSSKLSSELDSKQDGRLFFTNDFTLQDVKLLNENRSLQPGDILKISLICHLTEPLINPIFTTSIMNSKGILILEAYSNDCEIALKDMTKGTHEVLINIANTYLANDVYSVTITVASGNMLKKVCWLNDELSFKISADGSANQGIIRPEVQFLIGQI